MQFEVRSPGRPAAATARRAGSLFVLGLLGFAPLFSRQVPETCGTYRGRLQEELFLHRRAQRLRLQTLGRITPAAAAVSAARADSGDVAILEDADGIVIRRNDFNLDTDTLTFTPSADRAQRYRFAVSQADTYDPAAASAGARLDGLGDDDSRPVSLPFAFPYFGASYRQVFVNSDGNLTFLSAEAASTARSLGRLNAGPPRIAPLFRDLDPTQSRNGVYVLADSGRLVVSWVSVPAYRDAGIGPPQTFQVRLYPDGKIEFAYSGVTSDDDAVVGLSPGGLPAASSVVHFSCDPHDSECVARSQDEYAATIAERFGPGNDIDFVTAGQKFYQNHDDAYDYLVIFNTLGIPDGPSSYASERTVRQVGTGFGDESIDVAAMYGSPQRLRAVVNMGPISQYPRVNGVVDLQARMSGRPEDTPLTILAHEAGHLFLAYASIRDPLDSRARPMLGYQNAHWSFNFNSEASLAEGNRIQDKGAGVSPRFLTTGAAEGYSPLDQYLMGLRPPEDVPPAHKLFYVIGSGHSNLEHPLVGVSFNGSRRDVGIDELIAAVGRRTPDSTVAQHRFRFGFILLVAKGATPSDNDLASLAAFRQGLEQYFSTATSGLGAADTGLRRAVRLSIFPAAGVLRGASITASVSLAQKALNTLTISLKSNNGLTALPASVDIPAGATRATFTLTGLQAGVDEIVATPADPTYETAVSRLQVATSTGGLKLRVLSGDNQAVTAGAPLAQPVVLQVTDLNNTPYPGIPITASVSAGGTLSPAAATTDEAGCVSYQWTPSPNPQNQLTASIDGVAASTVTVAALGRPFFPAAGVVNAASYQPEIAPGSLASVFGVNLAAASADAASLPWPTSLGNVRVTLGGRAVPLLAVRTTQVNFLVPADTPPGPAAMVVTTPLGDSAPVQIAVASLAPGIFFDSGSNVGAILVAGTGQKTNVRAAAHGEYLEIYSTGLGSTHAQDGLSWTDQPVKVFIAGQEVEVPFSGLAPGYIGLYQVNARIPDSVPSGAQPVYLEVGGKRSNTVTIQVR